jgi:nitrite reductase/ring-hydroxylating ferredoxin subunit/putative sterol carrier protein
MGARFPFTSYPRGWYVVAISADVAPGEVKIVRYFGRDIVLFRGESGTIAALHKACPHLGAHLGLGKVEGDRLRCVFHGWAFDGEGGCVDVPYAPKIPPKAKAKAWDVREHNGVVQLWFCPHGEPPQWEPPVLEDEGWTPNHHIRWVVKTHPQEVAENTVDCAHLGPVHDVSRTEVRELEQDGHYMRVLLRLVARATSLGMPDEVNEVDLDVKLWGLGQLLSHTHVRTAGFEARQRIHPTPIDEEQVAIFGLANTKEMPDPQYTQEIDQLFWDAFVEDFARDFPIWETKDYLEQPVLAGGDGPIGKYRRWARQFYDDERNGAVSQQGEDEPMGLLGRVVRALRGTPAPVRPGTVRLRLVGDGQPLAVARVDDLDVERPGDGPRFPDVDAYFSSLEQRYDAGAAGSTDAVFQWILTGPRPREHYAVIENGVLRTAEGRHPSPTVTIQMASEDYLLMINGDLNGAMAFSTGRGKLSGPVRLAMKMKKIFPLERAV